MATYSSNLALENSMDRAAYLQSMGPERVGLY